MPVERCCEMRGETPIGTKWIDVTNNCDGHKITQIQFAATPLLDMLEAVLVLTRRVGGDPG